MDRGKVGTIDMIGDERRAGLLGELLSRWRGRKALPFVGTQVLDLGCGRGTILRYLGPGVAYTGVDRDVESIQALQKRYPQHEFYISDLDDSFPPLRPGYDTVLLLAVLEHLKDPRNLLLWCNRLLRPGGRVVITIPTPWGERVHRIMERFGLVNPEARTAHLSVLSGERLRCLVKEMGGAIKRHRLFQFGCNRLFVYEKPVVVDAEPLELRCIRLQGKVEK